MATTAKPKKGKKVTKAVEGVNVSMGMKKAPVAKGDVVGHMSPGMNYLCWNCGTPNYVPFGWNYFICWRCGAFNRV